jgi:hypothetical protein
MWMPFLYRDYLLLLRVAVRPGIVTDHGLGGTSATPPELGRRKRLVYGGFDGVLAEIIRRY